VQQRPDQGANPPASVVAPSAAAGTLRAVLVLVSGTGVTGVFVYQGAPGPTTLIASMTNSPTDPFGTPTYPSVAAYAAGTERVAAQLDAGEVIFNRGASVINAPAAVGSNDAAPLIATSGLVNATDLRATLSLNPATAGTTPIAQVTSGALTLTNPAQAPPQQTGFVLGPALYGAGGRLNIIDGEEGVNYGAQRLILTKSANQTITSGAAQAVTFDAGGLGFTLPANSTYRLRAVIRAQQNALAADLDDFQFNYSGTVGFSSLAWNSSNIGAASGGAWAVVALNANISLGPAGTTQYVIYVEGFFTVTTAGTFQFFAVCGTAGGTFAIQGGTLIELAPVV
jgi:hypothetical protein